MDTIIARLRGRAGGAGGEGGEGGRAEDGRENHRETLLLLDSLPGTVQLLRPGQEHSLALFLVLALHLDLAPAQLAVDALFEHSSLTPLDAALSILRDSLPPLFSALHPKINPSSGRYLARPYGGSLDVPLAAEINSSSPWKQEPGVHMLLAAAIKYLPSDQLHTYWNLLVPPLVTLLDDSDPRYRQNALVPLNFMLSTHPSTILAPLLWNSGVHLILQKALSTSFSYVIPSGHHLLVRDAFLTSLALIDVLYPNPASPSSDSDSRVLLERFEALSLLFDDGIANMWAYAGDNIAMATITAQLIPPLLSRTGLPSVRFLKALVPQLTNHLRFPAPTPKTINLHINAANALVSVVDHIPVSRLSPYIGVILTAVAQCWTYLHDNTDIAKADVKTAYRSLKDVITHLHNNNHAINLYLDKIKALDPSLFADLCENK